MLRALVGRLDGLRCLHAGPDVNFEGMDRGYRHGFVLDFADSAARLPLPRGTRASTDQCRLGGGGRGRCDGILVVDLEVPDR